jgi:hypothetical protein
MASSINASTSGGGGIITTADATGNLNIQSGGSTVVAVTSAGASVTGTLAATGAVSGTTGTFTGAVTTPLSYVRLNTANGYGSTNTKIRRFTNIVNNVGTDITYADSATLGGTFTINANGVYSVGYNDQFAGGPEQLGFSRNSTQLTTGITGIAVADILTVGMTSTASQPSVAAATFYANSGDVIRAHTSGVGSGTQPNLCQLTIARVQ